MMMHSNDEKQSSTSERKRRRRPCPFFRILAFFLRRKSDELLSEFLRLWLRIFSFPLYRGGDIDGDRDGGSSDRSDSSEIEVEDEGREAPCKQLNSSTDLPPPRCKGCKTEVGDGMSCVNAFDALWHPQCLCCLHCHKPIALNQIYKRGQFHKPCYRKHSHPNCYVCDNRLPRTNKGIKYHEHRFWKEKYCPCHDHDGTAKCCSCERLKSCRTTYVMLEDGRRLCRECKESTIMNTDECIPLQIEIREFFRGLHIAVDKEFPLRLVKKEALNKAEDQKNIHKLDNQCEVVTRGMCLSEEHIFTIMTKRPRMGPNEQQIALVNETRTVSVWKVTAIFILCGLPRLLTGYILAHEMMHAWLRLNDYQKLNIVLEEGICQVLAYMWLESQSHASSCIAATTSKKDEQSDFDKRFTEFCKYQIETDDSPVYGLGFREVHRMMISNHYVIKDTLKEIVWASKTMPAWQLQ